MNVSALFNLEADWPSRIYHWVHCQLNSKSMEESRDNIAHNIKQLVDCCKIQGVLLCENCTNVGKIRSFRCLASWFNGNRTVKAIEALSKYVRVGTCLSGDTGMIEIFELYKVMGTSNIDFWRLEW